MSWTKSFDLRPGAPIRRTALHDAWGGGRQGGIAPSREVPAVFFFTEPEAGLEHGYIDHFDGQLLHYAGEGQRGDQEFARGNKAILLAAAEGRVLRGFAGARGTVRYLGEFQLEASRPWYVTFAPDTTGQQIRQVIMFRMRPLDEETRRYLPLINQRLKLGHIYRPLTDYLPGMVAPPKPIDGRRRPLSHPERGLLEWWLAERIAAAGIQPLSPGPADPPFDLAYRAGNRAVVCAIDDPEEAAPLIRRLTEHVHRLNAARDALSDEIKRIDRVIAIADEPDDARIPSALRDRGVHLTWDGGPPAPAVT